MMILYEFVKKQSLKYPFLFRFKSELIHPNAVFELFFFFKFNYRLNCFQKFNKLTRYLHINNLCLICSEIPGFTQ